MSRFSCDEKRHRSPNWQLPERELLLEIVQQHFNIVECKKLDGASLKRKDAEWALIARKYNLQASVQRTGKVLRAQWGVMRKLARKDERMYQETGETPQTKNPLHSRIVNILQSKRNDATQDSFDSDALMAMQDDSSSEDFSLPSCSTSDSKERKFNSGSFDSKEDLKGLDCSNADDSDGDTKKSRPLSAFSARDCRLLLHCVRQEKNVLFSNSPLVRKQKAWCKIARAFNRQSPTKRSPPELKKKFQNLKAMASRVNNAKKCFISTKSKKYEELNNESMHSKIKSEPKSDGTDDIDFDNDDDNDSLEGGASINNGSTHADDPLSNGVTAVTGLGLFNHSENKEVDKLKIELLNYELETAKLQRKRIEDAIETEKRERDLRALETSLRIRAARLDVLAAEAKIPPLHPALNYTADETRAQQYLTYRTA